MKIFLTAINAKYIHSNLAVYSLRAYAKDYQEQIAIGEYTINNRVDYILEQIYKAKPDVLCFSCYIWNMDYVEELITEYHKLCPEVPIWVGGPEVSYEVETFLAEHNFQLQNLIEAEGFDKLEQLQIAANAMCETLHIKKTFQTYASEINKLIKYTDRNDISEDIRRKRNAITAIYDELQKKRKHSDIESLKVEINGIINEYIQLGGDQEMENRVFDISKINFDLLHVEFVKSKKRNLMFKDLAELIEERLELMLKINPNRVDLYERYRKIIDEYNEEQDRVKIEEIFMELLNISQELDEEQCRYVREGFDNDEELAFFDMLRAKDLSKKDVETLKKVASDLLKKIKDRISSLDNFMAKPETRSDVFVLIRNELYTSMPESYSTDVLPQYTQKIYEYVCTHYQTAA